MVVMHPGVELFAPFAHPSNAGKEKPVIDFMTPVSVLKRDDWYTREGVVYGSILPNSLAHFCGKKEVVDYMETYSSYDCTYLWWSVTNICGISYRISWLAAGNLNLANPRTRWAHNMCFTNWMVRANIAALIAFPGFFYGYEFMYTYVPGLKINDPSPNAWKEPWKEGQSTFLARSVASLFPVLGYCFFHRTTKRAGINWLVLWVHAMWYEYGRTYVWSTPLNCSTALMQEHEKRGRLGSLVPSSKHEVDPDTCRTFLAASHKHQQYAVKGEWQDLCFDNLSHEYSPMTPRGVKVPNPYYNPKKANQLREPEKMRYRSQQADRPAFSPI